MAYPPTPPANNTTNETISEDNHPGYHNDLADNITDIVEELGDNPKGEFDSVELRLDDIDTQIAGLGGSGFSFRMDRTWVVSGNVTVPSGDTDYIPPFFVSLADGETKTFVKAMGRINSGTSATVTVRRTTSGGSATDIISGWVVDNVGTGETFDNTDTPLNEGDRIELIVTAVAGSPKNMTISLFIDCTFGSS